MVRVVYRGPVPAFRDRVLVPYLTDLNLRLQDRAGRGEPEAFGPYHVLGLLWESFSNLPERLRLIARIASDSITGEVLEPDGVVVLHERGPNTQVEFVWFFYLRDLFAAPFVQMLHDTQALVISKPTEPPFDWVVSQMADRAWVKYLNDHYLPYHDMATAWRLAVRAHTLELEHSDMSREQQAADLRIGKDRVRVYLRLYRKVVARWNDQGPG